MHRRALLILLFSCVARGASSGPNEVTTVADVLDRYETALKGQSNCYIRSETQLEFSDNRSDKIERLVARSRLYKKGGLVSLYKERYRPVSSVEEPGAHASGPREQYLWNGIARYDIRDDEEHNSDDQYCYVSLLDRVSQSGESILSKEYPGHVLEGYTFGDYENFLTILRDHPSISRIHSDSVNGNVCHVVEVDVPNRGSYRIWFDPAHGYNICRAQVTRTATDTFLTKPVSEAFGSGSRITRIESLLHDVVFEKSLDVWFPVKGRWQLIRTYENGDTKTSTFLHRCVEVVCGRDDSAFAEAFVPHVRNGAVVYEEGTSPFLRRRWINGKPRPAVNWPIVRAAESTVDQYVADLTKRATVISLMGPSTGPCDPYVPCEADSDEAAVVGDNGMAMKTRNHCGLYCIYAAVRASGKRIAFTELLKPEYLGSGSGSSFSEIKRAAQDFGLHAEPVEKLTIADLKASRYCGILHVKRSIKSPTYGHYVLYLGMEGDQAILFDAPNLRRVPLREIAPLWKGSGVLLASEPIDVARVLAAGRVRFAGWSFAAIAMVVLVRRVKDALFVSSWCLRRKPLFLSAVQVVMLGGAALLAGLGYHLLSDMGMVANWKATASVQKAHSGDFLPRIGLGRARSLLAQGAVFVDARLSRDYKANCVPGAVNIPVDANEIRYKEMIAGMALQTPIVVYCQSSRCGYAGEVAGRLAGSGFRRVCVFKGGWYEWAKRRQEDDRES